MRSPRRVRSPRRATLPVSMLTALTIVLGTTAALVAPPSSASASPAPAAAPTSAPAGVQADAAKGSAGKKVDVRLTRSFYVNQTSQAWQAGQADPRFADLGSTPQAYWMSDNWMPLDKVQSMARTYVDKANAADQTPLVAIYAIPARDCGSYSAGGFGEADYKVWISRMAQGLKGGNAMAVLEPDALGHLGACDGQGNRTALLRYATKKLAQAGVWVYIDAAHNAWVEPGEMASRLARSGVKFARGFATNMASFVSPSVDAGYAKAIKKGLKKRGIKGTHWITDTSRNGGVSKADGNDWCNPLDARVGIKPGMVGQGFLDGYIWGKSPGESDGPCNGGPAAGLWWPDYALRLTGQL